MSLQEITQGVTRVHTNVKKTRAVIEQVPYFIYNQHGRFCILHRNVRSFFFGGYQYYLFTLPTPSLFMFKLYKFHVQIRIDLKER